MYNKKEYRSITNEDIMDLWEKNSSCIGRYARIIFNETEEEVDDFEIYNRICLECEKHDKCWHIQPQIFFYSEKRNNER